MLRRVGAVEIWRIPEIDAPFLTPEELWPETGPAARAAVERHVPRCLCPRSGRAILPIQGFLLKMPSHVILVDACVGNDKTVPGLPAWNGRKDARFMAGLAAVETGATVLGSHFTLPPVDRVEAEGAAFRWIE